MCHTTGNIDWRGNCTPFQLAVMYVMDNGDKRRLPCKQITSERQRQVKKTNVNWKITVFTVTLIAGAANGRVKSMIQKQLIRLDR
jgi:hypothetical protein